MANRKRTTPIYIHISEEERILLAEKMKLSGTKTISAYLRQLIRYGFVFEVDYAPIREMNGQLGKIGGNVNQITRRMNETKHIYAEDIKDLKEMMEKIWRIQKSILLQQPSIKQ